MSLMRLTEGGLSLTDMLDLEVGEFTELISAGNELGDRIKKAMKE